MTPNIDKIVEHYNHAREKHPYFCDRMLPAWAECNLKELSRRALDNCRARLKAGEQDRNLIWNELVDCEVWEAFVALASSDKTQAVEELYDTIAVLLRVIDVLEGQQKLGKPEKEGGAK